MHSQATRSDGADRRWKLGFPALPVTIAQVAPPDRAPLAKLSLEALLVDQLETTSKERKLREELIAMKRAEISRGLHGSQA